MMFPPLDIKLIVAYKSPFFPAITYLVEAVKGCKPLFEILVITEAGRVRWELETAVFYEITTLTTP